MNLSSGFDVHRKVMRRHARHLLGDSSSIEAHLARIDAALNLSGSEPVQGALADIFTSLGAEQASFKRDALARVRTRLNTHIARWFESQVQAPRLPRISPLATRWSVLSIPSADISTRARRCSADDSRALAARAVQSVEAADAQGEQLFLHHCVTCHDNLAFMLARRQLLKVVAELPASWDVVSQLLEQKAPVA